MNGMFRYIAPMVLIGSMSMTMLTGCSGGGTGVIGGSGTSGVASTTFESQVQSAFVEELNRQISQKSVTGSQLANSAELEGYAKSTLMHYVSFDGTVDYFNRTDETTSQSGNNVYISIISATSGSGNPSTGHYYAVSFTNGSSTMLNSTVTKQIEDFLNEHIYERKSGTSSVTRIGVGTYTDQYGRVYVAVAVETNIKTSA